jgi:two-component system sensor histidine kinase KdpD
MEAALDDVSDIHKLGELKDETRYRGYAFAFLFVLVATGVGWLGRSFLYLPDDIVIYLYVIIVSALLYSWGPALVASMLSVLAFDFFFFPPVLEFNFADIHYVATFGTMFCVGLLVSKLTSRIRREQRDSVERERRTAALYALSRALGAVKDEGQAAGVIVHHAATALGVSSALLLPDSTGALGFVASEGEVSYQSDEKLAVAWTFEHGQAAGRGTGTHANAYVACVPLAAVGSTIGVLVANVAPEIELDLQRREVLDAFGRHGGLSIAGLRATEQLKVAELRARTEAMRGALLSSVSRDLRAPLSNITEAATQLRDDPELLEQERRAAILVKVCDEAERMERLIAKLLDMTQLESGEHILQRIWLPCEELLSAAFGIVQDKIAKLTIRTDISANLPLIAVEPPLIEHLLANLFENAVSFAGPHATVDVAAHSAETALVIEIADNGPGIPVGTEERIFEKFFRASKSEKGGSGLGLAICRAIIEIHGGSISASNRPSGGAVFRVTIPVVGTPPELPSEEEFGVV